MNDLAVAGLLLRFFQTHPKVRNGRVRLYYLLVNYRKRV